MSVAAPRMLLGFAITEHCNLRCTHCIRDDVTTVRNLEPELIASVVGQARDLFGSVLVSLTGGEPLLHAEFPRIIDILAVRRVPYRIVSNGWHLQRELPILRRYPPQAVRLSLSGGTSDTHDAERGRGSFRRLLTAVALLTNERIPCYLSLVVDRRSRHELRVAADLAESLGCPGISFILPQPTPGSAARNSDLPPQEWFDAKHAVETLAREPGRRSQVTLDYGHPFEHDEELCDTFSLRRIYVDARGRLCMCCQLSDYGFNEAEVVADLHVVGLAEAHGRYVAGLTELHRAQQPDPANPHMTDPFPCLRCVRASQKLQWLQGFPQSSWCEAVHGNRPSTSAA